MATRSAYGASAAEICELFADYLQGDAACAALVLSEKPLRPEPRNAVEKSMEAFGFAAESCAFATLTSASSDDGNAVALDPSAVFMLVEGLDPLYVIAADARSCSALGAAYRTDFPVDSPARAFGRPAAGFSDLGSLLETPEGKQRAWKVLKSLPHR